MTKLFFNLIKIIVIISFISLISLFAEAKKPEPFGVKLGSKLNVAVYEDELNDISKAWVAMFKPKNKNKLFHLYQIKYSAISKTVLQVSASGAFKSEKICIENALQLLRIIRDKYKFEKESSKESEKWIKEEFGVKLKILPSLMSKNKKYLVTFNCIDISIFKTWDPALRYMPLMKKELVSPLYTVPAKTPFILSLSYIYMDDISETYNEYYKLTGKQADKTGL